MDAYVLGTHDGELPVGLLGNACSGRVRAIGALEDAPHTVYVALEGDTSEALEAAIASVNAGGIVAQVTFTPNPDTTSALAIPLGIIHWPSRMPPWERLIFIYLATEVLVEVLQEAVDALGPEGVAAAFGADGSALVEVGGDDIEAVEAIAASIASRHAGAVSARVASGGLSHA